MTSPKRTTPSPLEQLRSRRADVSRAIESLEHIQRRQEKPEFCDDAIEVPGLPHNDGLPSILAEQFTYLVQHAQGCALDCPECKRLQRIAYILMEPFQTAMYPSDTTDQDIPGELRPVTFEIGEK